MTDTWIIIRLYQILREKPQCLPFPWPSMCVYLRSSTYQIMTHILPNPFVFGYLGTNIQRSAQQDLTTRTGTEKNLQMLLPKELSNPPLKERGFDVILLPYISSWHTYDRYTDMSFEAYVSAYFFIAGFLHQVFNFTKGFSALFFVLRIWSLIEEVCFFVYIQFKNRKIFGK